MIEKIKSEIDQHLVKVWSTQLSKIEEKNAGWFVFEFGENFPWGKVETTLNWPRCSRDQKNMIIKHYDKIFNSYQMKTMQVLAGFIRTMWFLR